MTSDLTSALEVC